MSARPKGPPERPEVRRPTPAAWITQIGGAAVAVGAFLSFAHVDFGQLAIPSRSVAGIDRSHGKAFLAVGVGLLIAGVLMWAARSVNLRRVVSALAIVGGAIMVYVAILDIAGIEDEGLASAAGVVAAQIPEVSAEQAREALEQFDVSIDRGIGLYVVLVGSALGIVGGLLGLLAKRPRALGR